MATDFTPDQQCAIDSENQDVCVVAGPGSGKTTVLVERYRRLIEWRGFDPGQILAITFTEKAAANMREKLSRLFEFDPDRRRELESSSWVSTIHGFCMRLLREHAIAAGLDPRFTVLSPRESDRLQWECLQFALDEIAAQRYAETLALIEALHSPHLAGELKEVYDGIRSAGMSIDEVRRIPRPAGAGGEARVSAHQIATAVRTIAEAFPFNITPKQREEKLRLLDWCEDWCETSGSPQPLDLAGLLAVWDSLDLKLPRVPQVLRNEVTDLRDRLKKEITAAVDHHAAPFRAMIFDVLARFDEEYRNRKIAQARVDFNDLERDAIALLKDNPDIRDLVQKQFRQVMLDEFQDVNGQQAELIALLRSDGTFFGVGDRNQSIYGFRHARPEIFAGYQEEVAARGAKPIDLRHNFRSRAAILRCVETMLAGKPGIDDRELVAGRTFAGKDEPSIEILRVQDPSDDRDAARPREAAWIAQRVRELEGTLQLGSPGNTRPAEFHDFAVLCRGGDSMTPILEAFDRAGIPYVCGRRPSYLVSRTGRDITALLRVIANPRDSISLATVLRGPFVGVSDEGLLRLKLLAGNLTSGLNRFAHQPEAAGALFERDAARAAKFFAHLERWRSDQPLVSPDLLLSRALSDCGVSWTPGTTRGVDIESFLQLARTTGASMDLHAFLGEIESLADAVGTESDLSDGDQGNNVQVMTAHAAKGLEFNITIIAAMDKGTRNESGPVTFTPQHGMGVKWRNPLSRNGKDELKDSWAEQNKETTVTREKDEGNRLLYVAMTRAAEHLVLSYCAGKSKPANWAGLVDACFIPGDAAPSGEPRLAERNGFIFSFLVTESNPHPISHLRPEPTGLEIPEIARPVIGDRYETTVAVTSLAVFGACPRKYYIQRSLGWNGNRFRRFDPDDADEGDPGDADAGPGAARIGSAVHEILAGLPVSSDAPEARRLADVFVRSELGQRAAASPRLAKEWAFAADIDGSIIRGTIDLWFEEDGQLHLVDYKTDTVTAATAPARAREYAPQLALYAMALERALGARPRVAWLHFLRPDVLVEVTLDEDSIGAARSLIAGLRKAQEQLRFDLNEGEHCGSCQFYKSLCPAGHPAHNEDDGLV